MSDEAITRRRFIKGMGAAALSLPLISSGLFADEPRPNFVFILTDDQRFDAMSCAGHPFYYTPNIDRIAKEGARFSNAFVVNSLCSPSRACFLTGRYSRSHGIINNSTPLAPDIPTFLQALQKSGYDTAFIGKWHMGAQAETGVQPGVNRFVSFRGQGVYMNPTLNIDGKPQQVSGYMTDILTRYAADWLRAPRTSPFCLYLSHKAVHGPLHPANRHAKLYSGSRIAPPSNSGKGNAEPEWLEKRRNSPHGQQSPEQLSETVREYGRVLAAVDDSVGRVLDALKETGALDNTVVVFAGDNGYFLGEHGLIDKRAMYEESIRIPFLMRFPKLIKPGTTIDPMVLNVDLFPTFCDLAGVKTPGGVQGRSIKPLLSGRNRNWREDWYYEYFEEKAYPTPTIRGVRTRRWKYIEYPDIKDTSELYDLKNDPGELNNLINDPSHAAVLADMRKRLQRLMEETK